MGTPEYMSPEQAQGFTVDTHTDRYGLAVVACEMVSGQVPFDAESILALLHKIVYELRRLRAQQASPVIY